MGKLRRLMFLVKNRVAICSPALRAQAPRFCTGCRVGFLTSPFNLGGSRTHVSSRITVPCMMEHFWHERVKMNNKEMVELLKVRSRKVAAIMESVDRALFVAKESNAYADSPMCIGHNATISAPHMHAECLVLLEEHLQPGMHALDVGSGSGYLTACFALMVGSTGRAVGVEHIPELVASSMENINKSPAAPLLRGGSLSIHEGDGRKGWLACAPYDAIHVGAAASEIPKSLLGQLKPGGRMVIPVDAPLTTLCQKLKVIDKAKDGSLSISDELDVRYVRLTSKEDQLRG